MERDPVVEAIEAVLPGANCGGCGLAGCGAYAEAVVADHALMGKCGPGGEALVHKMAEILGIEATAGAPMRAIVHCSAHSDDMISGTKYDGLEGCMEAQMVGGAIGCTYGCLGQGDCVKACDFDAIHIIDGLAVVDYTKCVGCGACETACPRNIISIEAMVADPLLVVGCKSHDKAKEVRGYCKVGCIGCTVCAKKAPELFTMDNALPVLNYEKYETAQGREEAVEKCPRNLFVYVGKNAKEASKPAAAVESAEA